MKMRILEFRGEGSYWDIDKQVSVIGDRDVDEDNSARGWRPLVRT